MNRGASSKSEVWTVFPSAKKKDTCYYLYEKGKRTGPYSLPQLRAMVETASARKTTPCKTADDKEWHDLGYILKVKKMGPAKNISPLYEEPDEPFASATGKGKKHEDFSADPWAAEEKIDPSVERLIAGLIEVNKNQNSLLQGIKWGLWSLLLFLFIGAALATVLLT